jgi:hypothetical protein
MRCSNGHEQIDVRAAYGERPACPECGASTEILWRSSFPNVIGDECDYHIENMSDKVEHFTSKAEHRRRCKELGIRVKDQHLDHEGPQLTSRWV